MSRFFTAGDSSSESSSSDEEELYSEEENEQKSEDESDDQDEASDDDDTSSDDTDGAGKSGVSRFLRGQVGSDDSEDEDKVTIVKSAKDKRLEELETVARLIENAQKINDWSSISTGQDWKLLWMDAQG
jgi:translation initiation factor 3 subunit C